MKYYLHYISNGNNGIYGKDKFIKEAKELGVSRSFPIHMAKKLKWGDIILLGIFQSAHAGKTYNKPISKDGFIVEEKNKKFIDGKAEVFGYFEIFGINLQASNLLKERLTSQLDIINSKEVNTRVLRDCGECAFSTSHHVSNSIEDVLTKAYKLSKELQEKIKIFLTGEFHREYLSIFNVNFSRSYVIIDLFEELIKRKGMKKGKLQFIFDYKRRAYVRKKDRINV